MTLQELNQLRHVRTEIGHLDKILAEKRASTTVLASSALGRTGSGGTRKSQPVEDNVIKFLEFEKTIKGRKRLLLRKCEQWRRFYAQIPCDRKKFAFELKFWEGLTYSEVAMEMGISENAVKMEIYRYLRRFEKLLLL